MDLYLMAIRMLTYMFLILLFCSCHDSSIHISPEPMVIQEENKFIDNTFDVRFDKEIYQAGDIIDIDIIQDGSTYISPKLIIDNGPQILTTNLPPTRDHFIVLPDYFSTHAGTYTFCIEYNSLCLHTTSIKVQPLSSSSIYTLTGPKTINADGRDASMVVNVPEDKYGNVVKEGTPIFYESVSKSKNETKNIVPIRDQLSYSIIMSDVKATSQFIGITDLKNSALEQRVDFVPQWPEQISINHDDYYPYANNKNFVDIKTDILLDKNNNKVNEGTYIRYIVTDHNGQKSLYNSLVVDGISRVRIKNPDKPSTYIVYAQSYNGVTSNQLQLQFASDIESIKYYLTDSTLVIGPLKSQLGQLISEGTKVDLIINEQLYREETFKGFAKFALKYLDYKTADSFIIKVAGQTSKGKFN